MKGFYSESHKLYQLA